MEMEPAYGYLPHHPPMLLVDRVSGFVNDAAEAAVTVTEHNPFVENGRLEGVALAEMIAQAFAGCKGVDDKDLGAPPRNGMLVAMRRLEIKGEARVGDSLLIHVAKVGDFGAFTVVDGSVTREGEELATASLRVWTES